MPESFLVIDDSKLLHQMYRLIFSQGDLAGSTVHYAANGREYRHWLRADTGYRRGVWASRPIGANARTSLTWHRSDGLVDVTPSRRR